jgi:hypothetical protein
MFGAIMVIAYEIASEIIYLEWMKYKIDNEKEALEFNALEMFRISGNILPEVKTMRLKGRLEVLIWSRVSHKRTY